MEHILQWLSEERCMGGKSLKPWMFETVLLSYLIGSLAGHRIFLWSCEDIAPFSLASSIAIASPFWWKSSHHQSKVLKVQPLCPLPPAFMSSYWEPALLLLGTFPTCIWLSQPSLCRVSSMRPLGRNSWGGAGEWKQNCGRCGVRRSQREVHTVEKSPVLWKHPNLTSPQKLHILKTK